MVRDHIKEFLDDPKRMMEGLNTVIDQNQKVMSPIKERMEIVEGLLEEDMQRLKWTVDLYIVGTFSQKRLIQHKKQLENRISRLTTEYAGLSNRFRECSYVPEQTEMYRKFAAEISGRLKQADKSFDHPRKIIDFLNVNVALASVEDKRSAQLIFALGETILNFKSH